MHTKNTSLFLTTCSFLAIPSMVHIIGVVSLTIFLPLGTAAISRETLTESNRKTAETDEQPLLNHFSPLHSSKTFRLQRGELGQGTSGQGQRWNRLMSAVYRKNISAWASGQFGAKSTWNQCEVDVTFCRFFSANQELFLYKRNAKSERQDQKEKIGRAGGL